MAEEEPVSMEPVPGYGMIAKVTVDGQSKYYQMCRDPCYSPGSLLIGALGGIGVGFYTHKLSGGSWNPFITMTRIPNRANFNLSALNLALSKVVLGPVGTRALTSGLIYCTLQCYFQGKWYRRGYFDCAAAGVMTGALFAAQKVPRSINTIAIGGGGFGLFALFSRLFFQ